MINSLITGTGPAELCRIDSYFSYFEIQFQVTKGQTNRNVQCAFGKKFFSEENPKKKCRNNPKTSSASITQNYNLNKFSGDGARVQIIFFLFIHYSICILCSEKTFDQTFMNRTFFSVRPVLISHFVVRFVELGLLVEKKIYIVQLLNRN